MSAVPDLADGFGRILADQAAEMLFLVDPVSLRVVLANPAASSYLGYGREQLTGMRIDQLDSGLVGSVFWRDLAQSVHEDCDRRDTEFRCRDGSWLPVERRVGGVEHDGRRYLIVSARDTGAVRSLERQLDDVTGQLNSILECTSDGILALDLAGRVLVMNRAFADLWQISWLRQDGDHRALPGRLARMATNGPAVAAFLDCDSFAVEMAQTLVVELVDGAVLCLNSTPLKIAGTIAGRVISCSDVTERMRYEARLAKHNEMLEATVAARTAELSAAEASTRMILESTADGLIGLDREATISFVNRAACELLGCQPEQLMGRNLHEALHRAHGDGTSPAAGECALVRAVREGRELRDEDELFRCADGGSLPVSIAVHPMARNGDAIGAVLSFSDTTPRRETERARDAALAEARRLARIKSEFLANMSHEIRTPLNGVIGIARIGHRKSEGRAAQEYFSKIIDSGNLLLGIINDILDFSKIDAGKLQLEPRIADPVACLEHCLALIRPQADAGRVDLVFKLGPDIPSACLIDSLRLEQIVINLLSNAIKFTEQGSVTLALRRDGGRMVLSVTDTGIGMDADQLARIFEPFEQADGSTTRRFGGTGLGLSITRRLVQLMQGRIGVDSAPGAGSRFEVELPLVDAGDARPANSPAPADAVPSAGNRLAGLRILVAEDNEINQFVITEMLRGEACEVALAADGEQAVALAAAPGQRGFDLVLMDVQMPVLNGYEATRRIHEFTPQLPIVALTAHALAEERRKCLAAGMEDIVSKPIDPERLIAVIRHRLLAAGSIVGQDAGDSPAAQPGYIDFEALQVRWRQTPGMVERLLRIFLDSREDTARDLREAAAAGDMRQIGFIGHSMKGALGNIAAEHGAKLGAATFRAAEGGDPAAIDLARRLADEVDTLKLRAAALLADSSPG